MVYLKLALLVAVFAHCTYYVTCLSCPSGWYHSAKANRCWINSNRILSFNQGKKTCQQMGGTLPMPKTNLLLQELNTFRNNKIGTNAMWIGLNKRKNVFVWIDGTSLSQTHWNSGQPDNGGIWRNEHCVELQANQNGGWNDLLCSVGRQIVCERMTITEQVIKHRRCPDGWTESISVEKCWKNIGQSQNHGQGRRTCRNLGATLPMLTTNSIQNEFKRMGNQAIWIGLTRQGNNFVWDDGTSMGQSHWSPGEPTNGGFWRNEHCVEFLGSQNGNWNDLLCSVGRQIVCEKKMAIPINHCATSPCKNGAVCNSLATGFSCQCSLGFTGNDCGTAVNHCATSPCKNGAVCQNGNNGFICQCSLGFRGKLCGKINHCAASPCKNGGACKSSRNDFSCTCPRGFYGKDCAATRNYCATALSPCRNGGACTIVGNDFSCTCPRGFYGKDCAATRNYCATSLSPCKNGGACTFVGNDFSCTCPRGFYGKDCAATKNHCEPSPCKNGGHCSIHGNDFMCACPPGSGITTKDCSATKKHCAPNPCKNGGVCTDLGKGFSCKCLPGLSGKNCAKAARIIMMNRVNGKVNFDRNMAAYEQGFGNCATGDCWVGLKSLHYLCSKNCEIGVALTYKGKNYWLYYSTFKVGPKSDNYRLTIAGYRGNAFDHFSLNNNMQFTTKDMDNDMWKNNCASVFTGGWWYNKCFRGHPTGTFGSTAFAKGINWKDLTGFSDTLSTILMKVKRKE